MRGADVDLVPLSLNRGRRLRKAERWSGPDIQFMDLLESTIRYCIARGNGPTLVIATDPPVMIEHYRPLIDLLVPHFKVVVLEQPAFGFSLPKRSLRLDLQGATEVMGRFLERLDLGPYILHFPCIAGFTAINLAHTRSELVQGLVVTQTADKAGSLAWRKRVDPKNILGTPVLGQLFLRAQRSRVVRYWFGAALGNREHAPAYSEISQDALRHGACYCLASALQEYLNETIPDFTPLHCPTLVIWGERDRTHRHSDKAATANFAHQAQVVFFPEAGHFPDLEAPEHFAAQLVGFVRDMRRQKAGWTLEEIEKAAAKEWELTQQQGLSQEEPESLASGDMRKIIEGEDYDEKDD